MKPLSAVIGGFAGASALTLMHETARRTDARAPRMDLLGMNALAKLLKSFGFNLPTENKLFKIAMGGDIFSNAMYYSLAGTGSKKHVWKRGTLLGLGAGLGAVLLPKRLGLGARHTNRTTATQVATVALYVAAGLVTAATITFIERRRERRRRFTQFELSDYEG